VFFSGLKEFLKHRETVAFTFASGFITGAFLVYLSSSQHVFEDQYGMVDNFPYIFAGLACSVGLSTFLNGTLVLRFGMRHLALMAMCAFCVIALSYVVVFWEKSNPSVLVLVAFLFVQFFCLGFLWGNFRSIAMEPIGHIAGIGAAINGFVSTVLSVPIANFIGGYVQDTVWPMFAGLAVCGLLSLGTILMVTKRKVVATA
ncbi:Bcr/CflA family drug resistance efflux transporter, partial [Zobellia sp.]|nr:Bcr/CflA family drug resistance efflux transporter [Zobellia sp.]